MGGRGSGRKTSRGWLALRDAIRGKEKRPWGYKRVISGSFLGSLDSMFGPDKLFKIRRDETGKV